MPTKRQREARRMAQRKLDTIFGKPQRMSPAERRRKLRDGLAATSAMLREAAEAAMQRLSPREREIVASRYGLTPKPPERWQKVVKWRGTDYSYFDHDAEAGNLPPLSAEGAASLLREVDALDGQAASVLQCGDKHSLGWRIAVWLARHAEQSEKSL